MKLFCGHFVICMFYSIFTVLLPQDMGQDSSVGTVTGYRQDDPSSIPISAKFFSSPQHSDRL
jgi:hypothetical protein